MQKHATTMHAAATFAMALAFNGFFFLSPLLLIELGATAKQIAAICAGRAVVYVGGCLLAGVILQRVRSPRLVSIVAAAVMIPVTLALPFCRSIGPAIPLLYIAFGAAGLFWPPIQSLNSEVAPRAGIIRRLMFFNLTWGAASVLAPLVSGPLSELGMVPAFSMLAVAITVSLAATILISPAPAAQEAMAERNHGDERPGGRWRRDDEAFLVPCWSMVVLSLLLLSLLRDIYPAIAKGELGFSNTRWGMVVVLTTLAMLGGFVVMGRTRKWLNRIGPLAAVQFLAVVSMLGLYFAPSSAPTAAFVVLVLTVPLAGFSVGVTYFASIYYSVSRYEARGKRASLHESMLAIGALLGSLFAAGTIRLTGSDRAPCLWAIALVPLFVVAQVLWVRWKRRALLTEDSHDEPALSP